MTRAYSTLPNPRDLRFTVWMIPLRAWATHHPKGPEELASPRPHNVMYEAYLGSARDNA
jgi:hypothetical protein